MNVHILAGVVTVFLSICGIWFGIFFLYQDYCVDSFRHKMFSLRDRLFNDAAKGLIDFNHPAYGMLRNTMNGFLRFSHKLSLFQTIAIVVSFGRDQAPVRSFEKEWAEVSSDLDKDVVQKLEAYRHEVNKLLMAQIFLGSPLLLAFIVLPVLIFAMIVVFVLGTKERVCRWLEGLFRYQLDGLESTAMAYGEVN